MPVVFAPASPISAGTLSIAEEYGRSAGRESQANRQQQMRLAQMQQQTQAGIAAAQINARAAEQSAENLQRTPAMEFQANMQRHAQMRQIEAQAQAQQREQAFDWAVNTAKVGQQDMMRMQQMEAGLSQLDQDEKSGLISKEMAADSAYELRTGIDRIGQRARMQQGEAAKARQQQDMEETARHSVIQQKGAELSAGGFEKLIKTIPNPDGTSSQWAITGYDQYGPKWTQVKSEKSDQAMPGPFSTKTGQFDLAAAYKDAKTRAEADPAFFSEDGGKRTMKKEGYEWIQSRVDGSEREFNERKASGQQQDGGQRQPGTRPSPQDGQQVASFEQKVAANTGLTNIEKSQAIGTYKSALQLSQKPGRTPEEVRQLKDMLEYLDKVAGK